jgi:signal transduction histidine kinase
VEALGDPLYVARILNNLVNNALSYSRGTPFVRLRVRRTDRWVRFEVEDRGRGIAAADAERIFERFYRAVPEDQPAPPGSGLGLYICRQLAARQAGRLELEWSRVGEGSRFVLTLPSAMN